MEASWLEKRWITPSFILKHHHLLLIKVARREGMGWNDEAYKFAKAQIESQGRFKKVRECLAAANAALAAQKQTGAQVSVQLASDPPDFFFYQPTPGNPHLPWITYVEHTSFNHSRGSLADQLAVTKLKFATDYSYDFILLVEMDKIEDADGKEVLALIQAKRIKYKVWLMEGRVQEDDATIRVVAFNTPFTILADSKTELERFSGDVFYAKRVSSAEVAARREAEPQEPVIGSDDPPWPDPWR